MAKPITSIQIKQKSTEELQAEKIAELQKVIAEQEQSLNKLVEITAGLDQAGVLDAAKAAVAAKDELIDIAVSQVSKEPILNIAKQLLGMADLIGSIDAAQTEQLISGVKTGFQEVALGDGYGKEVGILDLLKAINDPDVNRAIKFGLQFLKGMGKGLDV